MKYQKPHDPTHDVLNLTARKHGAARMKWPWSRMMFGDTCDVYGDVSWRRHAAASAGGYTNKLHPEMRLRGTTLTDTNGVRFLRITAQHRLAVTDPVSELDIIMSPERVAINESIADNVAAQAVLLTAHRALLDQLFEIDTAWQRDNHPDAVAARDKLHRVKKIESHDAKRARIEEQRLVMSKQMNPKPRMIDSDWDK